MNAMMEQHQKDMGALISHFQQEQDQAWATIGALSRICINTSKTDADRIACATVQARAPQ